MFLEHFDGFGCGVPLVHDDLAWQRVKDGACLKCVDLASADLGEGVNLVP